MVKGIILGSPYGIVPPAFQRHEGDCDPAPGGFTGKRIAAPSPPHDLLRVHAGLFAAFLRYALIGRSAGPIGGLMHLTAGRFY
jgi:hypothetical protein